jgi:hypothetical protein
VPVYDAQAVSLQPPPHFDEANVTAGLWDSAVEIQAISSVDTDGCPDTSDRQNQRVDDGRSDSAGTRGSVALSAPSAGLTT